MREWIATATIPIIQYWSMQEALAINIKKPETVNANLEWVYGFRVEDCNRPIQYTIGYKNARMMSKHDEYG